MKIYNTLTKRLEALPPPEKQKQINMFVCGPTVYDHIHIGNARTFVIFDVVAKYLRHRGYEVKYVQNITDIDDKIIKRAHDEGTTPEKLAEKYTAAFLEDMTALGVSGVEYARASKYTPQIIAQVQKLIDRGYGYAAPAVKAAGANSIDIDGNSDVYFNIQKYEKDFPGQYGRLSGQVIENLEAEKRVEMEKNKKHPRDFVLWKARNYSYDWATDSPWGKGRPGWHIEDTAITDKYFGPQYDIHGGGEDLKFPHHEAEIAQQVASAGLKSSEDFVKIWMHSGFLINKEEKMSKSTGNFITLHEALSKYSPETLRFYFLSAHYRAPLDFNQEIMDAVEQGIEKIRNWLNYVELIISQNVTSDNQDEIQLNTFDKYLEDALSDDFNTSLAMSTFFTLINTSNTAIQNKKLSATEAKKLKQWLIEKDELFGIIPQLKESSKEVRELIEDRELARKNKDWEKADKIREKLKDMGCDIDDTPYGPLLIPFKK